MLTLIRMALLGLPMWVRGPRRGGVDESCAQEEQGGILTPCVQTHSQETKKRR